MLQPRRKEDLPYLLAVGRFTVNWGFAESALDVANLVLFDQGGSELEPELPRSLKRKLTFFRLVHEQLVAHRPQAERVLPLHQQLLKLKEWRHDLVHGIHLGFLTGEAKSQIIRWRHKSDTLVVDEKPAYAAPEINANARLVYDVGRKLLDYALEIRKNPSANQTNDSAG